MKNLLIASCMLCFCLPLFSQSDMVIDSTIRYDWVDEEWSIDLVNRYNYLNEYDHNINTTKFDDFGDESPHLRLDYRFNEDGERRKAIRYRYEPDGSLTKTQETFYEYDVDGNIAMQETFQLNEETLELEKNFKRLYSDYDEYGNNQKEQFFFAFYGAYTNPTTIAKEYFYTNGLIDSLYESVLNQGIYKLSSKLYQQFNDQEQIIERKELYKVVLDGGEFRTTLYNYFYNNEGQLESSNFTAIDQFDQVTKMYDYQFEYNSDGNEIIYISREVTDEDAYRNIYKWETFWGILSNNKRTELIDINANWFNPEPGILDIEFSNLTPGSPYNLKIFNVLGQQVKAQPIVSGGVWREVLSMNAGNYFMVLTDKKNSVFVEKVQVVE